MKKFFSITGFVVLYLALLFGLTIAVQRLWFSGLLSKNFAQGNYDLVSLIGFLLTLGCCVLIYMLRKKNLVQIWNLASLNIRKFVLVLGIGILMGTLTCCFCNTSLVVKNISIFEQYLVVQINGIGNFGIFLVVIAMIFACEEVFFRGTIFNEIRTGLPLYPAIIVSTLVYGSINSVMLDYRVGIYASVAALFFTLAYVYLNSLWASITLQIASIYVIAFMIKSKAWLWLRQLGDGVLTGIICLLILIILVLYFYMYKKYFKTAKNKTNTISA